MKLAMDTDALIKLTKSSAKELIGSSFEVILPAEVRRECVDQGKAGGFPDALRVEENIAEGMLRVRKARRSAATEAVIRDLRLSGGEADALRLFRSGGVDVVVSDDRRFLQILEAFGIPFATPPFLIVALVRRGRLAKEEALTQLDHLAGFIHEDRYLDARRAIEEG